jgi:hypothetical protein
VKERLPELGIVVALGGPDDPVEHGHQRTRPRLEIELAEHRGALAHRAPVRWRTQQRDRRDSTAEPQLVLEVALEGVYQHDLARCALDRPSGRELGDHQLAQLPEMRSDLVGELSEHLGPRIGPSEQDVRTLHDELELAFVSHESLTQSLGVEVHVVSEPLCQAKPDHVGGQHDGPMLVKRIVRHLHQRMHVGA